MKKEQRIIDIWIASDNSEHTSEQSCSLHEEMLKERVDASEQQKRNQRTQEEFQKRVQETREFFQTHPEQHLAFIEEIKVKNRLALLEGIERGWWESIDENDNPIPFPIVVHRIDFKEHDTMAHIFASLNLFSSVSEAKKNGWNKPIEFGEFKFKKKNIRVRIEE